MALESSEEAFRRILALDVSLDEQLKAYAESAKQRRPDMAAVIDRLVERLRQTDAGSSAPKAGDEMPSFCLPDENGRLVSLEQLLSKGPVALTFHRGHWCPYCRISINALARAYEDISRRGGQIVAISPDRQQFAAEMKERAQVPFPILTDIDNGYALSLNLAIWVGDEMRKAMAGQNLPAFQGNDAWMIPIPATFVVGQNGKVKARFLDPDYRRRMAVDDLIKALFD
jgi:peroxiredoxin